MYFDFLITSKIFKLKLSHLQHYQTFIHTFPLALAKSPDMTKNRIWKRLKLAINIIQRYLLKKLTASLNNSIFLKLPLALLHIKTITIKNIKSKPKSMNE